MCLFGYVHRCWIEELWHMNTNSVWVMWVFMGRELDHLACPLQGVIRRKLGRKKLKMFLHDCLLRWTLKWHWEFWDFVCVMEILKHNNLKRAKPSLCERMSLYLLGMGEDVWNESNLWPTYLRLCSQPFFYALIKLSFCHWTLTLPDALVRVDYWSIPNIASH